jgi:hypothetical protein
MAGPIIGRDEELALLRAFLHDWGSWPAALLLEGEAGIGKTALWETALSAGDFRGRVLRAHPAEAEIKHVGCEAHVTGPGEAMVESGGPTKAVNEGTTEALFYVTYMVPRGAPRTVPSSPPTCPPAGEAGEDDDEREDDD